jgi:hypothetical protein
VNPRLTLLRGEASFIEDASGVGVRFPDDVGQDALVGEDFRREGEEKDRQVGDEKTAHGSDHIWKRAPMQRAPVDLH